VAPASGHLASVVAVVGACAPDLDLLLPVFGFASQHRGPSHSLGAAAIAGLVVFAVGRPFIPSRAAALLALVMSAGWTSHLVLDGLGADSRLPLGLMALWPVSREYFVSPFPIFMDVTRELSWPVMRHNLVAMLWEIVLLTPTLLLAQRSRRGAR